MFLCFIFVLMHIFSSVFAGTNCDSLLYKDFNPQDTNEYDQVLKLMATDHLALLNPDEDPEEVLQIYIKALNGNPDKGYQGLKLKLLVQSELNQKNKVLGFISYHLQKDNKNLPVLIRTIAVDSEYRRKGLAKYLFSEVQQESNKLDKNHMCLAVYSNNEVMLSLLRKQNFTLYQKCEEPAFSLFDLQTEKETFVYTCFMCKELRKKKF